MKITNKLFHTSLLGISALLIGAGCQSERTIPNPTTAMETDTQVKVTSVPVSQFYSGVDGYSLSIPSGNSSTCIWTYSGGNHDVPNSETTIANSATEKHVVKFESDSLTGGWLRNFKVSCVDDFGNQYVGIFPKVQ